MSSKITTVVANFKTQIAVTIGVGSTTGAIKAPVVDSDGVQLVNGKYVMVVNLGESNEEHLIFDLVGLTGIMSNIVSISRQGVETVGALQQHRVGAKVVLTNYANLLYMSKILMGQVALDGSNPMFYDVAPTFSSVLQLVTKGYVDSAISGGVGTASDSIAGTNLMTKNQSTKPRARSTWLREQDTPDKTLKVESFRVASTDQIYNYVGGNTPNFIDPGFGGDMAFNTQPSNAETIVITVDGQATTVTFVTAIGATPGNVLIGGTVAQTRANFVALINNPTVTNANQVALSGAQLTAIQKLSSTDDLALNAFIRVIAPATTSFTLVENLPGAGNTWTANTTKNRIDLVVVDSTSTLQIRKGVEAVSPVAPNPTSKDVVIGAVLNRTAQTAVRGYNVAGQAYVTDYYDLTIYRNDLASATQFKFGGTGADGALSISSGATNIDLGGLSVVVKNYTSISITGTASLTFTNPHANGTTIIFKSQGNVDITSSANPVIDLRLLGSAGGAGGALGSSGVAGGGNGGGSMSGNGNQAGSGSSNGGVGTAGNTAIGLGISISGGGSGSVTSVAGVVSAMTVNAVFNANVFFKFPLAPGSGGGGAGGSNNASGGVVAPGGRGGGAMYIECGGNWNFTNGTINGSGTAGTNGGAGFASGGGGGGAGSFLGLVNGTITANTGTYTFTGGSAGTTVSGTAGASGANGQSLVIKNTEFA